MKENTQKRDRIVKLYNDVAAPTDEQRENPRIDCIVVLSNSVCSREWWNIIIV